MLGRLPLLILSGLLLLQMAGCETLGYYGQAISGQFYIVSHRRPIADLLAEDGTSEFLRVQLQTVTDVRAFAQDALLLPAHDQFTSYVDVRRPYVVWNVFAAPEFSLTPRSWCYPVAGCVSYRGYFGEDAARNKAEQLAREGLDVHVGGVTAYSTLGWFSDPVLNTVIKRDSVQLARLVFHELAHQKVYAAGDTQFNESFATAVELEGLQRWIGSTGLPLDGEALLQNAHRNLAQRQAVVHIVQSAISDLKALYASQLPVDDLRERKHERLAQLKIEHEKLRQEWGGSSPFDGWFAGELNNAKLATLSAYNKFVPAFGVMLLECSGELECFYDKTRELARLPKTQRHQYLQNLVMESGS